MYLHQWKEEITSKKQTNKQAKNKKHNPPPLPSSKNLKAIN